MRARTHSVTVALVLFLSSSASPRAFAQAPAAAADPGPASTTTTPASDAPAPATEGSGKTTSRPATGYGPSIRKMAPRPRLVKRAGPIASVPTFEALPDGGSRLEVHITQPVTVEERIAGNTATYVLKGAHLERHNDMNPLVTVHFNTPVQSARLISANRDLQFVVTLRANARPSHRVVAGEGGAQVLQVDFAKGDYMSAPLVAPTASVDTVPDAADDGNVATDTAIEPDDSAEGVAPKKALQKPAAKKKKSTPAATKPEG
ncbi:MAG: hypothetical protein U0169_27250 [Polyangiaceae bacterium]